MNGSNARDSGESRKGALPNQSPAECVNGASIQTIIERGRVTKIVVTCSCGKVTEVTCDY